MSESRKCIQTGCGRPAHARRLCRKHYGAAAAAGEMPPLVNVSLEMTDEERFFAKVAESDDGCWLWTGGRSDAGYGSFRPRDGSASNAHRWSYQFFIGAIPDGLVLDHLCRTRACVNPWHLDPVTDKVNIARGVGRDSMRKWAASLTHCPHGHEKSDANTYRSYNKKRKRWECVCRPCRNARLRRRAAEQARANHERRGDVSDSHDQA